jgi:phenylpropionate dioxygenase-like ring-hydroxylating dioxygenase large terminal subunit
MTTIKNYQESAVQPLELAKSLPFSVYTAPDVLVAEAEKIFSEEWVFVCMEGEIRNPGDYFAMTLANEPIIVIHGDDGELRALSNICRHRGTTILDEGFGQVDKYITCPYHAWAYSKEGALKAIPYNKVIAVDRADHHLVKYLVGTWNGLVFVNLDSDAKPLSDRLSSIDEYLQIFEPGTFDQVSTGEVEIWQSNWKLIMENAMESYHLFKVHENTLETISPTREAYYIAGSSEWTLTGGTTKRKKGLVETLLGSSHNELYDHYVLVSLPPSFVGIISYGSFGWLSAHPVSENTTQVRSGATYLGSGLEESSQSTEFTKAFFQEDQDMCERVQKGMSSKLSKGGKLIDMERVVVDFHQFLGTRLGDLPRTSLFEEEAAARWKNEK